MTNRTQIRARPSLLFNRAMSSKIDAFPSRDPSHQGCCWIDTRIRQQLKDQVSQQAPQTRPFLCVPLSVPRPSCGKKGVTCCLLCHCHRCRGWNDFIELGFEDSRLQHWAWLLPYSEASHAPSTPSSEKSRRTELDQEFSFSQPSSGDTKHQSVSKQSVMIL